MLGILDGSEVMQAGPDMAKGAMTAGVRAGQSGSF